VDLAQQIRAIAQGKFPGLILGVLATPAQAHDITAYQTLMLVLATTGLVAGELVTENRRTEAQLRLHQDSLSHLGRLGSLGELAAAIAHEVNQPLMAAGTYTRLMDDPMRSHTAESATVAETAAKAVAQVEPAAEVIRRLRALVRLDRSGRNPCTVKQIVNETLALCRPDLQRIGVSTSIVLESNLPPVWWISCRSSRHCSIWCAIRLKPSARRNSRRAPLALQLGQTAASCRSG
jgi:two-component system, LuxR family, sensor kinase FixL